MEEKRESWNEVRLKNNQETDKNLSYFQDNSFLSMYKSYVNIPTPYQFSKIVGSHFFGFDFGRFEKT